jgi:hypothetical protein
MRGAKSPAGVNRTMKATAMSNLASIVGEGSEFNNRLPETVALAVPAAEENRRNRFKGELWSGAWTFLFNFFDRSAFDHVSSGREVSVVFTPNGPFVFTVRERQN